VSRLGLVAQGPAAQPPFKQTKPAQQGLVAVHGWPVQPLPGWHFPPMHELPEQHTVVAVQVLPAATQLLHVEVNALQLSPWQHATALEQDCPDMLHVAAPQVPAAPHARPAQHGLVRLHVWPGCRQVVPWHEPLRHVSPTQQALVALHACPDIWQPPPWHTPLVQVKPLQHGALGVHTWPEPPHVAP
jgi:hypothetical protein